MTGTTKLFLSIALLPLFLFPGPAADAQEPTALFERLSTEDGLSSSTVWGIYQDSLGFLWFGSVDGLNRYDGITFRVYKNDPTDPGSLSNNEVMAICEDREGDLWIGTRGGGLDRFDRDEERFYHYRHDPEDVRSLTDNTVWQLLLDSDGELWAATPKGLSRYDREGGFVRYVEDPEDPASPDAPVDSTVHAMYEDPLGFLWLATNGGLDRLDRDKEKFRHYRHDPEDADSLSHSRVTDVKGDGERYLWIATQQGLNRLDLIADTLIQFWHDPEDPESLAGNKITELFVDSRKNVWVSTENSGLHRWNPETETFTRYRHDPLDPYSLSHDHVTYIFEDATGILWMSTSDGVSKYDPRREQFTAFRRRFGSERSLRSELIYGLLEDRDGCLWISTLDDGLYRIQKDRRTIVHYEADPEEPRSLPSNRLYRITEDSLGRIWMGTGGAGLAVFDRESETFSRHRRDPEDPGSLVSDFVTDLLEDSRGRMWVAMTEGFGYVEVGSEPFTVHYPAKDNEDGLGKAWLKAIFEDRTGTVWLGFNANGLYRLDPDDEEFVGYHHDPDDETSLSHNNIASLYESSTGVLWVGTNGGGLCGLDPERERFHRIPEGLPSNRVLGILEDDEGRLWVSTTGGLTRFDPVAETFQNFYTGDGLASDELHRGSALRLSTGEMLFGGSGGLTQFDPEQITVDTRAPRVVLTDFRLFDERVAPRKVDPGSPLKESIQKTHEIVLEYDQNTITFEFAALHFANPSKNLYEYRLEPLERDWIRSEPGKRSVRYTNLDPGVYAFRVKAANHHEIWNEEGASVRLTVEPPPWKTLPAYALYVLLGAVSVGGGYWLNEKRIERERAISERLREVDRLKDEFLARTSHELRTPLYGITGLAESLLAGVAGELPGPVKEQLAMAVSSGQRLARLVDDILDFSKLHHDNLRLDLRPVDLRTLTDVVLTLSRPLAKRKGLELQNEVPARLPAAQADEERLQQILHNLVGNAIKFTYEGSVDVTAAVEGNRLMVYVADTGIGIEEADLGRIFEAFERTRTSEAFPGTGLGLAISRQLVELHGGSLRVSSAPGRGSIFSFDLAIASEKAAEAPDPRSATSQVVPIELPPDLALSPQERPPEGGFHILIVDDDPVNRQVLVNHLAVGSYHLTQASDGPQALRLLEEQEFDLVLLDVMMPRMSGYEVCHEIRRRHSVDELPVIFLTARGQISDRVGGFALGANDFLVKPVTKSELTARVGVHLELLSLHRDLKLRVEEKTVQLGRTLRDLEEKNSELEGFAYTVSHDLKGPLMTILGFIGLLKRDMDSGHLERVEDDVRRIENGAKKMSRLVTELLELSRIGGKLESTEAVALGDVVREACESLAGAIAERGVRIDAASGLPEVAGDRTRLTELYQNLIENAVKFMGAQKAPRIRVGTRKAGEETVFFVSDNGMGIDERYHSKVFGLFERLDPKTEGTGIGLALAKRIVEVHGGRLWVESEGEGKGSTFCFTLHS